MSDVLSKHFSEVQSHNPCINSLEGDRVKKEILSGGVLLREMVPREAEEPSWASRAVQVNRKAQARVELQTEEERLRWCPRGHPLSLFTRSQD